MADTNDTAPTPRGAAVPDAARNDPGGPVSARSRRHLEEIASILGLPVAFFFPSDRGEPEPAGLPPGTVSRIMDLALAFAACGSEDKRDALMRYVGSVGGRTFDP
ncbi:hypothetical protein [Methylobacterium trifolii]|uniref:XRE family transcriptional regulator n=1 Tax=Methylobacterium trifolii TaxID=1003092 RepID=A0ABQ4U220_9HYPH|nr:hypothetical protein [Methylobacterium trifolii]GJE61514.1 hypothetical protein MPOCJGCO_3636 [Methylobacterium trifolii]